MWIEGHGKLRFNGQDVTDAQYKINIQPGYANGQIFADAEALMEAWEGTGYTLLLQDGREVEIEISSWSPGESAAIVVNSRLS